MREFKATSGVVLAAGCLVLLALAMSAHAAVTVITEEVEGNLKDSIVPTKAMPVWTMAAGSTVGKEMKAWGAKAGWTVVWQIQKDWLVPSPTAFKGEFPEAAAEVVKTLAANGALIRVQIYNGNKTVVVTGPGVSE